MSELRIEDDDGFVTVWPWPNERSLLASSDFVGLLEIEHDRLRAARQTDGETQETPKKGGRMSNDDVQVTVTLDGRLWRYVLDQGHKRNPVGDRSIADRVAGALRVAIREGDLILPSGPDRVGS